jgi:AcrR family transcriptional regulator
MVLLMNIGKKTGSSWSLDHLGREVPGVSERRDAARNRETILLTARALFERRGVSCVTMEEVAREAGVGKGTLYRRFPNKVDLCQAILDESTRRLQSETLEILSDAGAAPLEKLGLFFERLVLFTEQNLDLLSHPAHDWQRSTVLGLLRAAVRDGALGADTDLQYLSEALLAPLNVDLYYHQRRVEGLPPDRISAGMRSLVPKAI